MYSAITTAYYLADLDDTMRRPVNYHAAIEARWQFYKAAVTNYAIRRLNSLGELAPQSRLSERSLDVIFEDDRYSDAIVARIVREADSDATFRAALVEQEGETCLAYWRSRLVRDLFGQLVAA